VSEPTKSHQPEPLRASESDGDLSNLLSDYRYQPKLTKKLDDLKNIAVITPNQLNEIVLWKVNRYVSLDIDQLRRIDALVTLKPGEHRRAQAVLEELLEAHGIDLPMASTILRFRNPAVFQIIDRHAYRAVYGRDYKQHTTTKPSKKIEVYFAYVDELRRLCDAKGISFETADRVLYVFDRKNNGSL